MARSHLFRLLGQEIDIWVEKIRDEMETGIGDNSQYWRSVGLIAGLRGALRLCEDIERDLGNDTRPTEPEGD